MKVRVITSKHSGVHPGMLGDAKPEHGGYAVTFKDFDQKSGALKSPIQDTTIWFEKHEVREVREE